MNFLDSNLSGSHISTLPRKKKEKKERKERKKKVGRGANIKLVTNSIFIGTSPPNPGLKIKFGHNLH